MTLTKTFACVAALALSTTSLTAGDISPVVVEDQITIIPAAPVGSSAGSLGSLGGAGLIVPAVVGLAVLAAALSSTGGTSGGTN